MTAAGGHTVLAYCPYCGDEDLFPHGDTHGGWECRGCRRAFAVRFLGLLAPAVTPFGAPSVDPSVAPPVTEEIGR